MTLTDNLRFLTSQELHQLCVLSSHWCASIYSFTTELPDVFSHCITPEILSRYPNITSLFLSRNTLLREIDILPLSHRLKTLYLGKNTLLSSIRPFTRLEGLDIARNRSVRGEELVSLPLLDSLRIDENLIVLDDHLTLLSSLTQLELARNEVITEGAVMKMYVVLFLLHLSPPES